MREGMFIKKNVDKWNRYQQQKTDDPDETAERFITLVDDLSYAKTFYPHSRVTRWINGIAASVYQEVYKTRKEKYSRIFSFWHTELPLLFKKHHRILGITFLVFILFVSIGVLGAAKDETFIRAVLGNGYVDMTEDNIAKGDPFGVYRDDNPFTMFVQIALNNIFVAFLACAGGLLIGLGTLYLMWQNGLMLGCFQYMFFAKGLGFKSIMVIWIHGTLEILAIVISATAGMIIANGLLFPGTYSRLVSFKRGVKDALKVMLVLVPVFILAAFLESYVTHLMSNTYGKAPDAGLPVWAGAGILLLSFAFIAWYFIIHPIRLHRKLGFNKNI
ncbi:MAG TPA: stage II sporulation protein M [Ferruginibacter sp.]|nr:stage II sporulation protein M [Ferruginibacter sp.]HMP21357.1 stage II sporulation protein M [Ferruginibacter sp.]